MTSLCITRRIQYVSLCLFTVLMPLGSFAAPLTGVYLPSPSSGNDYGNSLPNYENWLNTSVGKVVAFGPNSSWQDITGYLNQWGGDAGLFWGMDQFAPPYSNKIVWSIPMLPNSGGYNLAAGAAGTYNSYWTTLAQNLIARGYGSCTIRLGWEFNGSWYPWGQGGWTGGLTGTPANYAAYWKNIVTAMRAVPGAHFKFNWCGALGDQYFGPTLNNPSLAFPAPDANGSYVDEIGVDIYDTNPNGLYYPMTPYTWASSGYSTPAQQTTKRNQNWTSMTSYGTYNLNWWISFASSKGLPLTVPEWGLANTNSQYHEGGGDNTIFVQNMYNFFNKTTNNVTWHSYFQQGGDFESNIYGYNHTTGVVTTNPDYPNATALFLSLFGSTTPTTVYPVFIGGINHTAWTGGYGTHASSIVNIDNGYEPYEGIEQYKVTYTSLAGFQIAFNTQNLTGANYLRIAIRGPITNSSQTVLLKLTTSTNVYGPAVTLTKNTDDYIVQDIPLSSLSTGLDMTKINSLYFYMTANNGTSDTYYLDNITFIHK